MISVQNRQQPLSGNKLKQNILRNTAFAAALGLVLSVSSCTPKVGVLRSPDVYGGAVGSEKGKEEKKEEAKTAEEKKATKANNSIALLLPFQLDRVAVNSMSEEDVKRSALALDFYQGFQLGMNEATKKSGDYALKVMDTQDSEMRNVSLAASKDVQDAILIVGPVYPKEIRSFGKSHTNKNVLQVNPLAAAMPTEFNQSNLVSITPPIRIHMRAVANEVASKYRTGDVVLVFDARDNDHRQFIAGIDEEIKKVNPAIVVKHVTTVSQLTAAMPDLETAFVITGTTEKNQLRSLISGLDAKVREGFAIKLFGHPLWDRFDFGPYSNFYRMDPTITGESHLKVWSTEVQNFQRNYKNQFKVDPSDFAYKGYDAGKYFTNLLNKYGADYADKLQNEGFNGIFSNYKFKYNQQWGYVNEGVQLRTYRNGSFQ